MAKKTKKPKDHLQTISDLLDAMNAAIGHMSGRYIKGDRYEGAFEILLHAQDDAWHKWKHELCAWENARDKEVMKKERAQAQ